MVLIKSITIISINIKYKKRRTNCSSLFLSDSIYKIKTIMSFFDKFFKISANALDKKKEGFFKQLLDKNNEKVSTTNFFVFIVTVIGIILLTVPAFVLIIEAWYNHTISTDLSGVAEYIAAVSTMFVTVGITKAWSNHSDNKLKMELAKCQAENEELIRENQECMGEIVEEEEVPQDNNEG